jgi:hypothetical protein
MAHIVLTHFPVGRHAAAQHINVSLKAMQCLKLSPNPLLLQQEHETMLELHVDESNPCTRFLMRHVGSATVLALYRTACTWSSDS